MCLSNFIIGLVAVFCAVHLVAAQVLSNTTVFIPYEYTYLLPDGYTGNVNETFVNGTTTSNATLNNLLNSASQAPFIAYDQAFLDILGPNPQQPQLIQQRADLFAYEAGVWVPERNSVLFTSAVEQASHIPGYISELNLTTNTISNFTGTSQPIQNANGGYYFEGKIYFASYLDNSTYRGGIISIDATTLQVETVLNSYFGLPFIGPDDIAWAKQGNAAYMFFTDLHFAEIAYPTNFPVPALPATVWRWDPQSSVLLPVISRSEVNPNGVRVSPDMRTLYVTDSTNLFLAAATYAPASGPATANWLGPYIYAYDLDANMLPRNRRVFGLVRFGIADGIHVDDAGNVWTGEYEGIVVRNSQGKVIGIFNAQYFLQDKAADNPVPLANFALAGDTLVVLATTRLYTVKLGRMVVSTGSSIVS